MPSGVPCLRRIAAPCYGAGVDDVRGAVVVSTSGGVAGAPGVVAGLTSGALACLRGRACGAHGVPRGGGSNEKGRPAAACGVFAPGLCPGGRVCFGQSCRGEGRVGDGLQGL